MHVYLKIIKILNITQKEGMNGGKERRERKRGRGEEKLEQILFYANLTKLWKSFFSYS